MVNYHLYINPLFFFILITLYHITIVIKNYEKLCDLRFFQYFITILSRVLLTDTVRCPLIVIFLYLFWQKFLSLFTFVFFHRLWVQWFWIHIVDRDLYTESKIYSSNWVLSLTSPKRKAEKYVGPNGRKSIRPYINSW